MSSMQISYPLCSSASMLFCRRHHGRSCGVNVISSAKTSSMWANAWVSLSYLLCSLRWKESAKGEQRKCERVRNTVFNTCSTFSGSKNDPIPVESNRNISYVTIIKLKEIEMQLGPFWFNLVIAITKIMDWNSIRANPSDSEPIRKTGLSFNWFSSNEIQNLFRIYSEWLGLPRVDFLSETFAQSVTTSFLFGSIGSFI